MSLNDKVELASASIPIFIQNSACALMERHITVLALGTSSSSSSLIFTMPMDALRRYLQYMIRILIVSLGDNRRPCGATGSRQIMAGQGRGIGRIRNGGVIRKEAGWGRT